VHVHGQHDHDDAHQDKKVADQGNDALRQQVIDGGHVVHHARNSDSHNVRVMKAEGQLLQMAEKIIAHMGKHALPHQRKQVLLGTGGDV